MKTKIPAAIRKQFPQVTKVRDARRTIEVNVLPIDATSGRKKDPNACALVKACLRERIADAAIIGLAYSWLIKKNVATRYKTSVGVSREITSFDRHQDFQPGKDYKLSKVSPRMRMGAKQWPKTGPHKTKRVQTQRVHHTAHVRQLRRYK